MDERIGQEIKTIEESALRLRDLARDNPAILKNAEILLNFVFVLKFITPGFHLNASEDSEARGPVGEK